MRGTEPSIKEFFVSCLIIQHLIRSLFLSLSFSLSLSISVPAQHAVRELREGAEKAAHLLYMQERELLFQGVPGEHNEKRGGFGNILSWTGAMTVDDVHIKLHGIWHQTCVSEISIGDVSEM